jgi:hypothetical protein
VRGIAELMDGDWSVGTANRPVVPIWHPDDPKAYVEIQFETQAAADAAVEQWNGILKGATGIEFGKNA